jgi:hypothetical protein
MREGRKQNEKRAAVAGRALDPDTTIMRVDDPFCDRETESGAATAAALTLPEAIE